MRAERTLVDQVLEVALAHVGYVEPASGVEPRLFERMQCFFKALHLDEPDDVVLLVPRACDDDVFRRDDEEALAVGCGHEAVVAALEARIVAQADGVGRELFAVPRDDAQFGTRAGLALLLIPVLRGFVVKVVFGRVGEHEEVAVRAVGCNARDHAVDLEDSDDLDEELCRARQAGHSALAFALFDDGDLDDVGPCDEESTVVAPMQVALEQIGARTVLRTANVGDALTSCRVVYPNALFRERQILT